MTDQSNLENLRRFEKFVQDLKQSMQRQYDRNFNSDLSKQQWRDLFIRNVTASLQHAYAESLVQMRQLPFKANAPDISARMLHAFDGFIDEFIQYALQKHRTSCALSNFPDEHKPSADYIEQVLMQTDKDWHAFVEQVGAEWS